MYGMQPAKVVPYILGSNPTQDKILCNPQMILLNLGVTLYSLLVLFTLDIGEYAYISGSHIKFVR